MTSHVSYIGHMMSCANTVPKWLIAIYHPTTNWDNNPTELGQKSEKIAQLKWGKNLKKLPS